MGKLDHNLAITNEDRSELEQYLSTNNSGLEAVGRAVLIRPYEIEVRSTIAIPDHVRKSQQVAEQRAVVIQIGPEAWKDEMEPRAAIGDHVMVTKYAGFQATGPKDGEAYRLINDRDIFCRISDPIGDINAS